jgi:hypothetical protein
MTLENMSFEELVTTAKNLQKQYSGIENENILLKSQKTSLESKIDRMHCGQQTEGAHFVELTSEGLPPGVYFYTLEINGRVTDSKKMTVMQ